MIETNDTIDKLAKRLASHYSSFDVANRLLFSGHSHQAWPDIAKEGLLESFRNSAKLVDTKWDSAFEKAEILRNYLREFYDDPNGLYCLEENTHILLVSWLSGLDLKNKPKIITTDGEFHSMYRQLHRLEEEGIRVIKLEAESDYIAEQLSNEIDHNTAAVMVSRVYFQSGIVNTQIPEMAAIAKENDVPFLIDDYHGTNVVPISLRENNLKDSYILIGGYKYLQWGEGNCFLRFPEECELRPAITGWFAAFSKLDEPRDDEPVQYDDGNQRFASGTYDSASQYRAAKVAEFFKDQELTPEVLKNQYRNQVRLMRDLFIEKSFDPSIIKLYHERPLEENGGFLAMVSPSARTLQSMLLDKGVFTDARGEILRMGPAPYITTGQIEKAIDLLEDCIKEM